MRCARCLGWVVGLALVGGMAAAGVDSAGERRSGERQGGPRISVGAIRWDAWTDWDLYPATLRPAEWHSRLPFYARRGRDGRMEIRGDTPAVMEREIRAASRAGIDYWAWCWYDPTTEEATRFSMNRCLELFRASKRRKEMRYCVIGGSYYSTRRWEEACGEFVGMFRDTNYMTVMDGRPLLYYFMSEVTAAHWGSAAKARAALDRLRARCAEAGLKPAYIVGLSFWPEKGAQAVEEVGFDAMGSYCNPGDAQGRELPYADLAALNRWFWNACKPLGKPFIPCLNAGWDYRPLMQPQFPERSLKGDHYLPATPDELAAHLRSALAWVGENRAACPASTVLIYAWNEFAEGGWLCPTLDEGSRRLDALGRALRGRGRR